jgi:hypothetical protein
VQHFFGFGLTIASAFDLPGAIPLVKGPAQPDIRISRGDAALPDPETTNAVYARRGDQLLFDAPGVARYLACAGKTLVIEPVLGADPQEVIALLIATALPMLVWMRGGFVLHASAIILPGHDQAVAIAGPSGSGKSTLLDQMVRRGARVLGDDTISIMIDKGVVCASGLPAGYFLPQPGTEERDLIAVPPQLCMESAPLGALLVIEQAGASDAEPLTRVTGVAALELLLQNRHRPRVPAIMQFEKAGFEFCAQLSAQLPIFLLHRKEGELHDLARLVRGAGLP